MGTSSSRHESCRDCRPAEQHDAAVRKLHRGPLRRLPVKHCPFLLKFHCISLAFHLTFTRAHTSYYDKHGIEPAFAFGHGLSYTTFKYSGLKVWPPLSSRPSCLSSLVSRLSPLMYFACSSLLSSSPLSPLFISPISRDNALTVSSAAGGPQVTGRNVSVAVTNTGPIAGAEIAQLYLGFPESAGEPVQVLRGFEKLLLQVPRPPPSSPSSRSCALLPPPASHPHARASTHVHADTTTAQRLPPATDTHAYTSHTHNATRRKPAHLRTHTQARAEQQRCGPATAAGRHASRDLRPRPERHLDMVGLQGRWGRWLTCWLTCQPWGGTNQIGASTHCMRLRSARIHLLPLAKCNPSSSALSKAASHAVPVCHVVSFILHRPCAQGGPRSKGSTRSPLAPRPATSACGPSRRSELCCAGTRRANGHLCWRARMRAAATAVVFTVLRGPLLAGRDVHLLSCHAVEDNEELFKVNHLLCSTHHMCHTTSHNSAAQHITPPLDSRLRIVLCRGQK